MEYTINIGKAGRAIVVNWDAMPEIAQRHIIEYGLRQKLNDAGSAAIARELGAVEAGIAAYGRAERTLAALMAGELRAVSGKGALSLEQRAEQNVIRRVFKAQLGRPFGKERDISNEGLLAAIAQAKGKSPAGIRKAIQPLIDKEITALRDASVTTLDLTGIE